MVDIIDQKMGENKKDLFLVLSGPSGAGKDETYSGVLKKIPDARRLVTSTSRPIRDGEKDGVDYNFLTKPVFKAGIERGDFAEYIDYRTVNGEPEYKGTRVDDLRQAINEKGVLIWRVDPKMAATSKRFFIDKFGIRDGTTLAFKTIVVYIGVPILRNLKERKLLRDGEKFNKEEFNDNLRRDWAWWGEYGKRYDLVVENRDGELETTINIVVDYVEKVRRESLYPRSVRLVKQLAMSLR